MFTLAKKGTKSVTVENLKSQFTTNQKGLLIMNVFTGQMTFDIHAAFNKNQICLVKVPANMIRFQQRPDLTVNRYAKEFMKDKFNSWNTNQVTKQLNERVKLDEVNVKLFSSTLNPLHAGWIVDWYNEVTSEKRKYLTTNG